MGFMNKGMRSKKRKRIIYIVVGIVIMSFLLSIVAVSFN